MSCCSQRSVDYDIPLMDSEIKQEPLESLDEYLHNDGSMEEDSKETFMTKALLEGLDNEEKQNDQDEQDLQFSVTLTCDICGQICETKRKYWYHKRTKHSDKLHTCKTCDETFPSRHKLDYHREVTHLHKDDPVPTCGLCTLTFKNRRQLKYHIETKHTAKSYSCNVCYAVFENRGRMVYHKEVTL